MSEVEMQPASGEKSQAPGNYLQSIRKNRGVTIEDVADQLHLVPSSIRAIEHDDYSGFQAEVYIKGYLKAYAKFLSIDPDDIAKRYDDCFGGQFISSYANKSNERQTRTSGLVKRKDPVSFIPMVGATAFLFVVAWLWFSEGQTQPVANNEPVALQPVIIDESDQSVVNQLAEDSAKLSTEQKTDSPETLTDSLELSSTDTPEPPAVAVGSVVAVTERSGSDLAGTDTKDTLFFKFTGDCWVEVKDMQDNVIYAALKKAEDTLSLDGNGPFKVLLGYAPVVTLDFNGERVEIDSNRRTNSAKLVVGRS